jgi:hypothetical protein
MMGVGPRLGRWESPLSLDRYSLDHSVGALYECVSFEEGEKPDIHRLVALFEPGARLIHAEVGDLERMSVDDFADRLDERAGSSLKWFREWESSRKQDRFGCIAQVFSTFEAEFSLHGDEEPRRMRGINSIQLRQTAEGWRITGILWTNEGPDQRIPAAYMP